jgi:hypothetical protein
LATGHHVSLWTSAGVLMADGMVPAGMAAPLIDVFRYVSVPFTLLPAGNYVIGAAYDETFVQDWEIGSASSITTAPGVTHIESRLDSGDASRYSLMQTMASSGRTSSSRTFRQACRRTALPGCFCFSA